MNTFHTALIYQDLFTPIYLLKMYKHCKTSYTSPNTQLKQFTLLRTIPLMQKIYLWHANWFHYFCTFHRNAMILLSQVTLVSTCLFFTSISILCHSIIKLEYTCYNQYLAKHHFVLHFPKSAYLMISIK